MSELPEGWEKTEFGEIAKLTNGRAYKQAELLTSGTPVLRIQNLNGGNRWYYSDLELPDDKYCEDGDLLYAWSATFGPYFFSGPRSIYHYHIWKVTPFEAVQKGFLYYILRHITDEVKGAARGVAMPHMTKSGMEAWPVEIPPLPEQGRIVTKLEACEGRIRSAREALDEVPKLLDQFRQSVLAAAFRGDLTRDWREGNPDVEPISDTLNQVKCEQSKTGRSASKAVIDGLAAIAVGEKKREAPSGWKWVPLLKVARMESGHTPSRNHPEWWDGDIPWIGIKDAREFHGKTITSTIQKTNEAGLANSASRLLPAETVCLSRTASVGYAVKMGVSMATSQDFANWICSEALHPEFLLFAFLAEGSHLLKFGRGSTHTTIYFPELKALQICLPPVEEQHRIAEIAQSALQTIELLEESVAQEYANLHTLTQSLLAKAFRGELVPQDPSDEPAEQLLARLRAQREAEAPSKKKKPKRKQKKPEISPELPGLFDD